MTIIELYDTVPIHNILGVLQFHPECLIYVGSESERRFRAKNLPALQKYFRRKNLSNMEILYIQVNQTDLHDILDKLEEIYQQNTDCRFHVEVTGGDDLILVAIGILCDRHPELNLFQISSKLRNIRSYCLSASENSEKIPVAFWNSVEDNLVLHGASILDGENDMFSLSANWNFTDEFLKQLDYLWDICCHGVDELDCSNCSYPNLWNRLTAALMELDAKAGERENRNLILISDADYAEITDKHIGSQIADQYLIAMMEKNILQIYVENDMVGIEFEDSQVRDCLMKSGNILELKTYLICKELLEDYSGDVRTGVVIDWDGKIVSKDNAEYEANTVNEIDVLATCGLVPYFISCKNGKFDSEELYKLYTVAEHFGTKYAQKIIVTTDLAFALKQHEDVLLQRAEDMGIQVIQNVHRMSDEKWKAEMTKAMGLPKLKRKLSV